MRQADFAESHRQVPIQWPVAGLAATGVALLALAGLQAGGWRSAGLAAAGAGLGIALYHASFGFTAAWRALVLERRSAGVRAQMVLLALTSALAFPLIGAGAAFGHSVTGFVFPVGVSLAVGAFLFGIGMQLGGACASGTLYTLGGGSTRMAATLSAFIAGSVIATAHLPWWLSLPSAGAFSMIGRWGVAPALMLHLAVFVALYLAALLLERRHHGLAEPIGGPGSLPYGPWPKVWGAVAIAALAVATLMLAGRPWGITSAFALWGAKALYAVGYPVENWAYWTPQAGALERPVLSDTTSLMNFAIMLGALAAAGLAGRFAPAGRVRLRPLVAAIIGGLLMGYGARLAFGCNIGAFFSGIASASLHGWVWLVCALPGTVIGIRLRPLFGL